MSKTKYNSETTITQAKCTKKQDEICKLFQDGKNEDKVCPQATRVLFLGSKVYLIMRVPATVRYEVTFFANML